MSVNANIPVWAGEQRVPGIVSGGGTGADGADGAAGLVWRGAWSALASYVPNDAVYYGGSSYICLNANSNIAPPNAAYWDLLATGMQLNVTAVQIGAYNAVMGDLVRCDPSGGGFTVTLPAIAAANKGMSIVVKNQSASTNAITVARTGGDTIDGAAASLTMNTARKSVTFTSDGTSDWMIT